MAALTASDLRSGILLGPLSRISALASIEDTAITAVLAEVEREVELETGCRMAVTTIRPWDAAGDAPEVEGEETEAPYPWPGYCPGDGFPRFRTRVRPLVSVESIKIRVPGALVAPYDVPSSWIRVDRKAQEILLAPTSGSSVLGSLLGAFGFGGFMPARMPASVQITYRAGLGDRGLAEWPQVRRLLELRAAVRLLRNWSLTVNPTAVSSISADGLSQSVSAMMWADVIKAYEEEAAGLVSSLMGAWGDGPLLGVL